MCLYVCRLIVARVTQIQHRMLVTDLHPYKFVRLDADHYDALVLEPSFEMFLGEQASYRKCSGAHENRPYGLIRRSGQFLRVLDLD